MPRVRRRTPARIDEGLTEDQRQYLEEGWCLDPCDWGTGRRTDQQHWSPFDTEEQEEAARKKFAAAGGKLWAGDDDEDETW